MDMDDFDEYGDWDSISCAEGDYNAFEDEQVFQDGVNENADNVNVSRQNDAIELYGTDSECACGDVGVIIGTISYDQCDELQCPSCGVEWEVYWG
jgi:hypothetical protein